LAERVAIAEEAVEVARASGDRHALVMTQQRVFQAISHPSTLGLRSAWTEEALGLVADSDEDALRFYLHTDGLFAALERADGEAVDVYASAAHAIAARLPQSTIRWMDLYCSAWPPGLRGDLAEFERRAEAALAFGMEHGEPDAFNIYGAQLANVRYHQGRLAELISVMEQTLAENPGLVVYRAVLAMAKAQAGDADAARRMLEADQALGFLMPEDQTWSSGFACWVEAAVLLNAVPAADALRNRILPYHDQLATTGVQFVPAFSHYLGLLDRLVGHNDEAERWFAEALQLHKRLRSPILVAQTLAAWAGLLADRGRGDDYDRGRSMAQEAFDTATAGGYGNTEAEARAVLERLS